MDNQLGSSSPIRHYLVPVLCLAGFLVIGATTLIFKYLPTVAKNDGLTVDTVDQSENSQAVSKEAIDALSQKPPIHQNNKLDVKKVGQTTIVSEGTISQDEVDRLSQLASSTNTAVTPYQIRITDTVGSHSDLINPLKNFFATSLLWTSRELPSLYEIRLVNVGASGWSGMYYGGYTTSGGQISSVVAYIDLNTYYYEGSPYLLDYLQMTLSHEYGHHYTLYNKWMSGLTYYDRFPDTYYQVRPLSKTTTAADYSKGWSNCDAEIIAEDYRYLFSPYKSHQMSGTYGYPSDPATRNWLLSFGGATGADQTAPTVNISTPTNGTVLSGTTSLIASASDNIAVVSVDFYLNSSKIGSASQSGGNWLLSFNSLSQTNGGFSLTAQARDQAGNSTSSTTVNISINNQTSDTTPPQINITAPSNESTLTGTVTFSASASDNVQITSVTFRIDATTLGVKTGTPYSVQLVTTNYYNGHHTLTAIASDGINSSQQSISVNLNNGTDQTTPIVQITAPSSSPYSWSDGNLIITANASDNVGVVKIEFYINDYLVASENSSSISRRWMYSGTPAGSYILKAKAYDAAGNSGEAAVQIDKS